MRVAVITNLTRKEAGAVTENICKELSALGAQYYLTADCKKELDITGAEYGTQEEIVSLCDVVIAVGGDGSIIHAAKFAVKYDKPILGINSGRLAFMAGLENDELNLLSRLIDGSYTLDKRFIIKTSIFEKDELIDEDYALNECYITNEEKQRMSLIDVALNGKTFNSYLLDAIILATPTGSTAYSLSAGGPVVDPELESILFTPVCPHSLMGRSIIFRPDDLITVYSPEGVTLLCSNDGETPKKISKNGRVEISRGEFTANFIRIKSDNFIDILYKKLAQRK